MSYVILTSREREALFDLFFSLKSKGEQFPKFREEAMTALRCLKAIHSNAIEDRKVDRIFLQLLLHNAGVPNKSEISTHYSNAKKELTGQEEMLRWLEGKAMKKEPFSLSMLLEMHRFVFRESTPDSAGRFRSDDVRISGMAHRPPHHSTVQGLLHQHFAAINERLIGIGPVTPGNLREILQVSAEVHYLVASIHPFEDGNGRIARAAGDYAMLVHGLYYDVIMTDYRDMYLDALEESSLLEPAPLLHFIEYSYLETLRRISSFFALVES